MRDWRIMVEKAPHKKRTAPATREKPPLFYPRAARSGNCPSAKAPMIEARCRPLRHCLRREKRPALRSPRSSRRSTQGAQKSGRAQRSSGAERRSVGGKSCTMTLVSHCVSSGSRNNLRSSTLTTLSLDSYCTPAALLRHFLCTPSASRSELARP